MEGFHKKTCLICKQYYASGQPTTIYTRKEIVMMETTISNFHKSLYITEIKKLAFHIPHIQILGTNHCGNSLRTAFKLHEECQDVLCCRDYTERVVVGFSHQIQSEYYGGNISVSIEVIKLEYFIALPETGINTSTKSCPRHAVFTLFVR